MKKSLLGLMLGIAFLFGAAGCASVPMESAERTITAKKFNPPSEGSSGLYIYRPSSLGGAVKIYVYVDGKCIGESAPYVFFYEEVEGDKSHKVSTGHEGNPLQSDLLIKVKSGMHYFIRQYIKFGFFVTQRSGIELVDEQQGKEDVSELDMATNGTFSSTQDGIPVEAFIPFLF